jgi:hypothetical protein
MEHAANARELAAQLLLRRAGREWRGACPVCGYADAFVLTEGKAGPMGWCASCQNREAIAVALGGSHTASPPPLRQIDPRDVQKRIQRAERVWRGTIPLPGTPAAKYLEARGIEHLVDCADLGFHSSCPHPSGTLERPVRLPALVAAVRDVAGRLTGVHRTYVRSDGASKADIVPSKASSGLISGGVVRLMSLEQVLAAGGLVVGEGIENSASAGLLLGLPAWSAVSAGNLAHSLALPAAIRRVTIAADRDAAGLDAARAAGRRWRAERRITRDATPDEGHGDFNDIVVDRREARA